MRIGYSETYLRGLLDAEREGMWEQFKGEMILTVAKAETLMEGAGGARKKEFVIAEMMAWLAGRIPLGRLKGMFAGNAMSGMVNAYVSALNARKGAYWGRAVTKGEDPREWLKG